MIGLFSYKVYFPPVRIHQLHRIPSAIGIRTNTRVLVRHWVDAQPSGQKFVVKVPCTEVRIAGFGVFLLAGESGEYFERISILIINVLKITKTTLFDILKS